MPVCTRELLPLAHGARRQGSGAKSEKKKKTRLEETKNTQAKAERESAG